MLLYILTVTACGTHNPLIPENDPLIPETSDSGYACARDDEPLAVADDDASHTAFNALEAVDFIDGFALPATYDLELSADTVPEEDIVLEVERTTDSVEYVNRTQTPPGVMGRAGSGGCLLGPLLRIPTALRWPTLTADGAVVWWETEHIFEVGSIDDPNMVVAEVTITYRSLDEMNEGLREFVLPFLDGNPLDYANLTAWGTLQTSDYDVNYGKLGIDVQREPEANDDGLVVDQPLVRYGSWSQEE